MRYLLDTHVLVWFAFASRKLSREHAALIHRCERSGEPLGLAAISCWEIALLGAARRLDAEPEVLFAFVEDSNLFTWLPLTPEIAIESTLLGQGFHNDPADRLIVATARVHNLKLVTADERIRESGSVDVT